MANDVAITAGVGTAVATDEIGGRHYQIVKQAYGIEDSATMVSPATPFPVLPGLKLTEQYTRLALSFAGAGDNAIVAAVAAQFVRIYGIMFTCAGSVSVKLGEGGPTYWTGAMTFGAGGGMVLMPQGEPLFITSAVNKSFLINLSAAVQVSGVIWYQQAA